MGHIGKWWTILDQLGQFWTCFDLCLSVKQRVLSDPDPDTVCRLPCKQTSKPPRPDFVPVWRRSVPFPVVPGGASGSSAPTLPRLLSGSRAGTAYSTFRQALLLWLQDLSVKSFFFVKVGCWAHPSPWLCSKPLPRLFLQAFQFSLCLPPLS